MNKSSIHKKVWTLLILTWICQATTQMMGMSWGMMMPSMMEELGTTYDVMGNIAGMGSLMCVILTIPVAFLVNKMPPKYTQPLVFILVGAGYLLTSFSTSIGVLYAGQILAKLPF